ncbi:hypothetical protein L210DRAFT_941978 [Boletus edulis BED1]|uniref:Uncharacterized protein n=1 Tax=Boletus edulis BED1 TaxID=1328754 RepID=A0AAD4GC20_BOLED|nr:hypothetical protein L210DRAFT_941978 [Boletus edulis BED1]
MSSQQDPYHYSGTIPTYDESGSESPVTRQVPSPGQLWSPTAVTGDPSGYSEHDQVGNLSEVSDVDNANSHSFHDFNNPISHPFSDPQDMDYPFNYPGPSQPLPGTSSQDPGIGVDATYIDVNPFVDSPFYYAEFGHGHPQYPSDYIPYSDYDLQLQSPAHYTYQPPAQDLHTQIPHAPFALIDPSMSWTQHSSLSLGEPVYQADYSTPGSLMLHGHGANAASTLDPIAGQHSHYSPVATSSNQRSAPVTSHPSPSSPDRERRRPSTAESLRPRRVVPRHDETSSVHSPGSIRRRRSNPEVHGRGILIPQERYRTSTISSYSAPHHPPIITFNLENPGQVGIPIIDILNKTGGFARIRDRTEAFNMEKKTFTLRIRWPGYKSWSKTISALDWTKSRAPVTRVKLAEAVATAIRDLFEKYRDEHYEPEYTRWNVGRSGIQLDQICLVALHQVSRGSWQPQLCLLAPRH